MDVKRNPLYDPKKATVVIQKIAGKPTTVLLGRDGSARVFKNEDIALRNINRNLHVSEREGILLDNSEYMERNL